MDVFVTCSRIAAIMGKIEEIGTTAEAIILQYLEMGNVHFVGSGTSLLQECEVPDFGSVDEIIDYLANKELEVDDEDEMDAIKKKCFTSWGIKNESSVISRLKVQYPDIEPGYETKVKYVMDYEGQHVYLKGRLDAISKSQNMFFEIKSRIGKTIASKTLHKCDEIQIKLYEYLYDYEYDGMLVVA